MYVYRKLQEIQFIQSLSRKRFQSLQEQVLQSINSNETFVLGKKLSLLTVQQISIIQQFIDTVKVRIEDGTFFPAKYTDPRGYRFFTIAPVYTVQSKAIQIDA